MIVLHTNHRLLGRPLARSALSRALLREPLARLTREPFLIPSAALWTWT